MKRKVLLTGAAGRIGSFCTQCWVESDSYELVLTDRRPLKESYGYPFHLVDLSDFDAVRALCNGIDTVVHLGADPSMQAAWESLLPNNLIATYNIFESAHQAGCRRVLFASSVNAVIGYPSEVQVHIDQPVRPINLYGATKVWGEGVASSYSASTALSCLCLRFGWVVDRESDAIHLGVKHLDITSTYHDMAQLITKAIEAPDSLKYGVFHGISNNRYKRLDITSSRELLGFEPQDDGFEIATRNAAKQAV
jgi:nucleoside-diphosphate-sugar epimerase